MFQKVTHNMLKYSYTSYSVSACILEMINYWSEIEQDINFQHQGNKSQITIYGVIRIYSIVSDYVFWGYPSPEIRLFLYNLQCAFFQL